MKTDSPVSYMLGLYQEERVWSTEGCVPCFYQCQTLGVSQVPITSQVPPILWVWNPFYSYHIKYHHFSFCFSTSSFSICLYMGANPTTLNKTVLQLILPSSYHLLPPSPSEHNFWKNLPCSSLVHFISITTTHCSLVSATQTLYSQGGNK